MSCKADRILTACVLAIAAVQVTLMVAYTPYLYDDLGFIAVYRSHSGGSDAFSLSALWGYICELRQYDNSRISNMLSLFSTTFEPFRTVFPVLCGLVWAFALWACVRIAGYCDRLFVATASLWTVTFLCLPWRDNLYVADYQLNYPYAAAATLSFLLLLLTVNRDKAWWRMPLTLTLALIAGGWHEGFSLPVIAGLGFYAVVRRFRLSWRVYAATAVYIASALAFALSPGILSRLARESAEGEQMRMIVVAADVFMTIAMLTCVTLALLIGQWRRRLSEVWKSPGFVVFFVASLCGCLVSLVVKHTPRTSFWPSLCAILVMLQIVRPLLESRRSYRLLSLVCIIAVAACAVVSVHAVYWQKRIYEENKAIMAAFGTNGDNRVVYHDVIQPEDVPLTTLYLPTRSIWITDFTYIVLDSYFGKSGHCVVPAALSNADPLLGIPLAGNVGAYRCGDALVAPETPGLAAFYDASGLSVAYAYFDIAPDDDTVLKSVQASLVRYTTADGNKMVYIKPYRLETESIRSLSYPAK